MSGSAGRAGGVASPAGDPLPADVCVCLRRRLLERCQSKTNTVLRIQFQEDLAGEVGGADVMTQE